MFLGNSSVRKKVSLGGASQRPETREDLVEKSRLERERRRREKQEDASARLIQARGVTTFQNTRSGPIEWAPRIARHLADIICR